MGTRYRIKMRELLPKIISDLMSGEATAGPLLRDVIDASIKGGTITEAISDTALKEFPELWSAITKVVSPIGENSFPAETD